MLRIKITGRSSLFPLLLEVCVFKHKNFMASEFNFFNSITLMYVCIHEKVRNYFRNYKYVGSKVRKVSE